MKRAWFVLLLFVTACGDGPREPPPIARDLDVSIENKEWPARLSRRFPLGTPEAVVLDTLKAESFTIDRSARKAKARWTKGICAHDVDVVWTVDGAERITSIGGLYFPSCP